MHKKIKILSLLYIIFIITSCSENAKGINEIEESLTIDDTTIIRERLTDWQIEEIYKSIGLKPNFSEKILPISQKNIDEYMYIIDNISITTIDETFAMGNVEKELGKIYHKKMFLPFSLLENIVVQKPIELNENKYLTYIDSNVTSDKIGRFNGFMVYENGNMESFVLYKTKEYASLENGYLEQYKLGNNNILFFKIPDTNIVDVNTRYSVNFSKLVVKTNIDEYTIDISEVSSMFLKLESNEVLKKCTLVEESENLNVEMSLENIQEDKEIFEISSESQQSSWDYFKKNN